MTGVDDRAALELSKAAICRSRLLLTAPSSTWAGWIGSEFHGDVKKGILLAKSCSPSSIWQVCKAAGETDKIVEMTIFMAPFLVIGCEHVNMLC